MVSRSLQQWTRSGTPARFSGAYAGSFVPAFELRHSIDPAIIYWHYSGPIFRHYIPALYSGIIFQRYFPALFSSAIFQPLFTGTIQHYFPALFSGPITALFSALFSSAIFQRYFPAAIYRFHLLALFSSPIFRPYSGTIFQYYFPALFWRYFPFSGTIQHFFPAIFRCYFPAQFQLVFKGPVRSGFPPIFGATATATGPSLSRFGATGNRTSQKPADRQPSVRLRSFNRFQPVFLKTGCDRFSTDCNRFLYIKAMYFYKKLYIIMYKIIQAQTTRRLGLF